MLSQTTIRINRILTTWLVILGAAVLLVIVLPRAIGLNLTPVLTEHPASALRAGDLAIGVSDNVRELSPGYTVLLPRSDDATFVLAGRVIEIELGGDQEEAAIHTSLGPAVDSSPWQPAEEQVVARVVGYIPAVGFLWDKLISPRGELALLLAFLLPGALVLAGTFVSNRETVPAKGLRAAASAHEQS